MPHDLPLIHWLTILVFALFCVSPVRTQFPGYDTHNVTTISSPLNSNITISFKNPPFGTCTTVFATQKQYTGYVKLPSSVLSPSSGNQAINTFFWFIEARQIPEAAPLTIFINGGPGVSSMTGMFQELGPCKVVEMNQQILGTVSRDWGWDRSSNLLFIDQPVQVGFSFDALTNKSLNFLDEIFVMPPADVPPSQPAFTFVNGTFASGNGAASANTSTIAAHAMWHFLQGFLAVFPQYNPGIRPNGSGDGVVGINLFTESYGGRFGPSMASLFNRQNLQRKNDPAFANKTLDIKLTSLGIMNGMIDPSVQMPFYPRFAFSNSYSIQAISQVQQLNALGAWNGAQGCQQLIDTCRAQQSALDPGDQGSNNVVNNACFNAQIYCQNNVIGPYTTSGRSIYDISQNLLDPFPDSLYLEYLNQADVQQALGVKINYTRSSSSVSDSFLKTGDYARGGMVQDIVELLEGGVRVALIYGDRDYICNWLGGEAVSYAIAAAAGKSYMPWYSAGYSPIVTNDSYIGGVVREFGNLSFARIYDAGHLIPAYQPETAFTVFTRIIKGTAVGLGSQINRANYTTSGDMNATHTNNAPPVESPTCYIRAMNTTCDTDQKNIIANRAGVIINGVLYGKLSNWQTPEASVSTAAGRPTVPPSSVMISAPPLSSDSISSSTSSSSRNGRSSSTTTIPTGVFTATRVPTSTSSSQADATSHVKPWQIMTFLCLSLYYALNLI